eukprot:CAMPEP_0179458520 /NCGR_PEP_ID=MMETSP0799-20121207/42059_1 /TAXON_ID=46947 /ORGANISM="Geminigera cryophila, Strain CCMP2564" /LENGTH=113 /DNA_ID=CAMNT_0021259831 /DNA_START=894 /DNA_END=1235 /DNA_ORIENTATION=-
MSTRGHTLAAASGGHKTAHLRQGRSDSVDMSHSARRLVSITASDRPSCAAPVATSWCADDSLDPLPRPRPGGKPPRDMPAKGEKAEHRLTNNSETRPRRANFAPGRILEPCIA